MMSIYKTLCLSAVFFLFAGVSPAQGYHADLIEAANAFAKGEKYATEAQKAMLIARNRDLQRLAVHKDQYIRDSVFQKCQAYYADELSKIAGEEAARYSKETGKSISVVQQQAKPGGFSGGTDLDLITQGKTTPGDITELQKRISKRLDTITEPYLSQNPGRRPSDWFKANDIDLMADARYTTPEDFRAISKQNNFAYERPEAARFEEWQRTDPRQRSPLDMGEMAEYMDEMKSAAGRRELEIQKLRRNLAEARRGPGAAVEGSPAWTRVRDLEADLHAVQGQKNKLIDRMNEATDALLREFPDARRPVRASSLAHTGKTRDLGKNAVHSSLASSLEKELVEDAFARHAEALAAVSKSNPKAAEACAENLRRMSGNLSPKKQVEIVENIRAIQGDEAAEAVNRALRSGRVPGASIPPQSLGAAARSSKRSAEALGDALRGGNHEEALQQLRTLKRDMDLARKFGQLPAQTSGVEELLKRADDILLQAGSLPARQQRAYLNRRLKSLFQDPAVRAPLNDFLKKVPVESALMEALARDTDAVRRGMLRKTLSEGGAFRKLREGIGELSEYVPVGTILTGLFVALDVMRADEAYQSGRMDEAVRVAFESVVGLVGGGTVSLVTSVGNMIIDAAKEGGYVFATGGQDLEDFLAGIVNVKGWESALDKASPSETDLESLARRHATSGSLESALDKLIRDAAARSNDTPEIRRGKEQVLKAKLWPQLHAAWLRLRMEEVNRMVARFEFLDLVMGELAFQCESRPETPEILQRLEGGEAYAEAEIRVRTIGPLSDLNDSLEELRQGVRGLGGAGQQMSLGVLQEVTLRVRETGEVFQGRNTDLKPVALEKILSFAEPGAYTLEVESVLRLRPYSTVTEQSQDVRESWSLLAPLSGLKYDPRFQEWSLRWVSISQREEITRNDQYRIVEFAREYRHTEELNLQVVDRGGDDRVIARVAVPREELIVGESLLAKVELDSRARLSDDIRVEWTGAVRPMESEALFSAREAGRFSIGASVYRDSGGHSVKLADAEPVELRVFAPEELSFALKIRGPARAKTGEAIRLVADRTVIPAADKALEALVVEWSSDGTVLDAGPYTVLEPAAAGEYLIVARLLDENGPEPVERARDTFPLNVSGPPADVGGPGGVREVPKEAPAPGAAPAKGPSPPKAGGARGDSHHSAIYGSTLELNFSDGRESRIEESNRELAEAMKERVAKTPVPPRVPTDADDPFNVRTDVPAIYIPDPRIPEGDDGDGVLREPDLPPGAGNSGASVIISGADDSESVSDPSQEFPSGVVPAEGSQRRKLGQPSAPPPGESAPGRSETPQAKDPLPVVRFRYIFHASPTLEFDPPESADGRTRVRMARVGEVQLWAQVVTEWKDDGEIRSETEETETRIYSVTPPAFSLVTIPETPKIGEEIRARLVANPAVPVDLLRGVWIEPVSKNIFGEAGESISFEMPAGGTARIRVEAREPYWGGALGGAEATLTASQYEVSASVLGRTGPRPRVWDTKRGGLVEVPENSYLVHEAIRVQASLKGTPAPKTVRWQWSANPGSTLRGSGLSDGVSVTRAEPGVAELRVEARDGNGALLGSAAVSVSFQEDTPTPPEVVAEQEKALGAEARKEVEAGYAAERKGQLDAAIGHYTRAQSLKPDERVAARITRVEGIKERITTHLGSCRQEMDRQDFGAADRELSSARNLNAYYPPIEEAARELTLRRIEYQQETLKRMDAVTVANQQHRYAEALEAGASFRKEMRVDESVAGDLKRAEDWARGGLARQEAHVRQFRTAEAMLDRGDAGGAEKAYREAMANTANVFHESHPELRRANEKWAEAREKLRADAERAKQLIAQGYAKEEDRDWGGALRDYREALKLQEDGRVRERIALVEGKLREEAEQQAAAKLAAEKEAEARRAAAQQAAERDAAAKQAAATRPGSPQPGPSQKSATQTGAGWVLVDQKPVRGKLPDPVEGGEVRADFGQDSIELVLARPYGMGTYSSKDYKNPQRLHARYSWTVPDRIEPGGLLSIPVTQRVFSNQTGNYANNFNVMVTIENRWHLERKNTSGAVVDARAMGIGNNKNVNEKGDHTVRYEREWLWKEGKEGDQKLVSVIVSGVGSHRMDYTYRWVGGAANAP